MAYREFRNEKLYEAPVYDFDNANRAIGAAADAIIGRKKAADAKKAKEKEEGEKAMKDITLQTGSYPNDNEYLRKQFTDVIIPDATRAIQANGGSIDDQTRKLLALHKAEAEKSKLTFETAKATRAEIEKSNDPYLNKAYILKNLDKAEFDEEEANINTRYDRVIEAKKSLDNIEAFNHGKFIEDFVAAQEAVEYGTKSSTEGTNGVTNASEKKFKGKYVDANGKPFVKDSDVTEFMLADPRVDKFYRIKANTIIDKAMQADVENNSLPPEIASIENLDERRVAYGKLKKMIPGNIAKEQARQDLFRKADVSVHTSTLVSRNFEEVRKQAEEEVSKINTIVPLTSIYKDDKGNLIENHFPVVGQSFYKGKAGEAKPIVANISLKGAEQLNVDPNSTTSRITNNNRAEVQLHGGGRVIMVNGKRMGTVDPAATPVQQAEEMKKIMLSLTPEQRKKATLQHVYYGKAIDKTKTRGDGTGLERKPVMEEKKVPIMGADGQQAKTSDGKLRFKLEQVPVVDDNGRTVYSDQYDVQEIPVLMNATQETDEILKKASKGAYDPHDSKKWSPEERELIKLSKDLGIPVVTSRTVTQKSAVRTDNEKRTYRNNDPKKPVKKTTQVSLKDVPLETKIAGFRKKVGREPSPTELERLKNL